jgi:RimJ/RimL family protein N-acetyltransferase
VPTLDAFVRFYKNSVDPLTDTFFIDPDANNPRAQHVYSKAGFIAVGDFKPTEGAFKGQTTHLMVRKV